MVAFLLQTEEQILKIVCCDVEHSRYAVHFDRAFHPTSLLLLELFLHTLEKLIPSSVTFLPRLNSDIFTIAVEPVFMEITVIVNYLVFKFVFEV